MSEAGAVMNVPKLRFPEFSGAWKEVRLANLGRFKSGVGFPEQEQGGTSGTPFFKVSDMNLEGNEHVMSRANHYVTQDQIHRLRFSVINDRSIIFAKVGAAIFLERKRQAERFLFDNNMMAFIPGKEITFEFCVQKFSAIRLSRFAQVGALPSYNSSDIGIIKVAFPTLPEQQNIADFLGAVDARVELLKRRREALVAYKKAMMQRLFARTLRFTKPDGSPFPDWQQKQLGEIATIRKGQQLNRDTLSDECEFPVINGGINASGYTDEWNTEANVITLSEGGNSCGYVDWQDKRFWLGGHCYAILPKSSKCYDRFLLQALKLLQPAIMRLRVGSGLPNIQKGDLTKLPLDIPHYEEQHKIAQFLAAFDNKIAALSTQIAVTQRFKQGLLQQMFV
ncbi:MAG: restriction endonuclease subunit S [Novosphingobium sp.]|uniref:restriction endonuclease subunit S n=1 Tax=Novosphingobium sp. TaxID=1874826 RepID=UPI0032BF1779